LIFEPGTDWSYSSGIDWAGRLVERVTGMTLEEYERKNMWEPLRIESITFFPDQRPGGTSKVPQLTVRTPDGKLAPFTDPFITTGVKDCFGGHGNYATMQDYLKVQRSILANDGKLLKPETVELMFKPQLTPESAKALNTFVTTSPLAALFIGEYRKDIELNWGLGGILFMQDDNGRRKKGTLNWGGMANPFWLIDREADLALTFGTQVLPPGDKGVEEMISAVEYGVYEAAGVKF
jgi:CubicO group peptidase (beta-lactamase class C family)